MIKTRTWVIIITAVLAVCAALGLWLRQRPAAGTVANIYRDGVCIRSVDLAAVTEPETFTVTTEHGSNTVLIEPGRIRIIEADCPDQVCVNTGWLSDSAAPIVCLPHRVVIRIESAPSGRDPGQLDSVSQ